MQVIESVICSMGRGFFPHHTCECVIGRIQTLVKMKNVPLSQQAQITMHAMTTMIPHWILKHEKFWAKCLCVVTISTLCGVYIVQVFSIRRVRVWFWVQNNLASTGIGHIVAMNHPQLFLVAWLLNSDSTQSGCQVHNSISCVSAENWARQIGGHSSTVSRQWLVADLGFHLLPH